MVHPCIVQCPFCTVVHSVHRAIQKCFDNKYLLNIFKTKKIAYMLLICNIIKIKFKGLGYTSTSNYYAI